jgi:hypothetical protein
MGAETNGNFGDVNYYEFIVYLGCSATKNGYSYTLEGQEATYIRGNRYGNNTPGWGYCKECITRGGISL